MRKLKLNPVILDTLDHDQLKRIMGGSGEADTEASAMWDPTTNTCQICNVEITPFNTRTTSTTTRIPFTP